MKNMATDKLTHAYLQKLDRQSYLALASAVCIIAVSLFWMLFHLGGKELTIYYADSMYAIASWIGSFWVCRTAYRARWGAVRLEPRHQLAWLLIGIGLFANGIGGAYYTYLEWSGEYNPVPSLADLAFTLFYIFTFPGLLLMPTLPKTGRSRVRAALDALIPTLCILGISGYYVIGPIVLTTSDVPKLIVAAMYPFWDILLLAILLLIYQRIDRILHPSLILSGTGIISQIVADTGYALTIPFNTYTTGTFYIDTFWFLGALLIGFSALYQYSAIARRLYSERSRTTPDAARADYDERPRRGFKLLQSLLVYLPLAVLLILMLYSEITGYKQPAKIDKHHQLSFFLVLLTAIVGILVTLRYLLATQENAALLRQRERRRAEAEHLRLLTAQLTGILELDPLLTRIVSVATSELGFDAALLLLNEELDRPVDAHSTILIRAAPPASSGVNTWRVQGERLPSCTILQGQEVYVSPAEYPSHLPEEIAAWHKEQKILATLFVPLIYQGKLLGSLGLSSKTSKQFKEHHKHIALAFSEEAATAIEHAHLYEVAHEHEQFARALANMAARLNLAVATGPGIGPEIQQLICREGANALQADYALLYVTTRSGHLQAIAAYAGEREPPTQPADWPLIRSREHEAQALYLLQPTLLEISNLTTSGPLSTVSGQVPAFPAMEQRLSDTLPAIRVSSGGLRARRMLTLREALLRRNVQAAILAPLIARNQPVALLVLARSSTRQKRAFSTADLPQAQDFAEQAAIAFTNAQIYQHLRNAHQHLQQLDQLKDQFMVTASHELRTPLTSVQGYLELLTQFGDSITPEQRQEFLQKARRGCDELVLLLSNVMDASRLEIEAGIRPAHLTRVSVHEVIQDVINLIEPQVAQENREVYMYVPSQLFVKADPARLRQILLNLSVNALKYSNAGTPITYSTRTIQDQVPAVIISVTDKGKGIKPQDQAQLFQRFVRLESDLNSSVRGSGLGLYISRRLVEAMQGKIWVESSGIPGAGSTFNVQLPLA